MSASLLSCVRNDLARRNNAGVVVGAVAGVCENGFGLFGGNAGFPGGRLAYGFPDFFCCHVCHCSSPFLRSERNLSAVQGSSPTGLSLAAIVLVVSLLTGQPVETAHDSLCSQFSLLNRHELPIQPHEPCRRSRRPGRPTAASHCCFPVSVSSPSKAGAGSMGTFPSEAVYGGCSGVRSKSEGVSLRAHLSRTVSAPEPG